MREIKFRAWDCELEQIVEWEYLRGTGLLEDGFDSNGCALLQFTGLKDKTEKDIYEGDIVECFSPYGGVFKAEVVFVDGCFEINEPKGKNGVFRDYLKCLTCNHAIKVIGNIYETPKLLTEASSRK